MLLQALRLFEAYLVAEFQALPTIEFVADTAEEFVSWPSLRSSRLPTLGMISLIRSMAPA